MTELADLIRELRIELAFEIPPRLHDDSGESVSDDRTGPVRRRTNGHPATWTGLPFAHQFDRFLSGNHGGDFPADDCFPAIRDWCRAEHWREQHMTGNPFEWGLCARIASAAVERAEPLSFIASQEQIDLWLVRRLLLDALRFADRWRTDRKAGVRISDESRHQLNESEALPIVLAREHSLAYEQRVWETLRQLHVCKCGGSIKDHEREPHPLLRSWESELMRRRAYHAIHCGGSCPLLSAAAA